LPPYDGLDLIHELFEQWTRITLQGGMRSPGRYPIVSGHPVPKWFLYLLDAGEQATGRDDRCLVFAARSVGISGNMAADQLFDFGLQPIPKLAVIPQARDYPTAMQQPSGLAQRERSISGIE
jgi:hypothetical protein